MDLKKQQHKNTSYILEIRINVQWKKYLGQNRSGLIHCATKADKTLK